jgi:predicted small metal-binding protein
MPTQRADQGRVKGQAAPVVLSSTAHDRGVEVMARVIHCECGFVARGATDEEVLDAVEAHVRAVHPELVGKVSRQDEAGWIQIKP